jgi:hypothetical protein
MPTKKNLSNTKNQNKLAGKRHAKLVAPQGEKVSSMKMVDVTSPILLKNPTQLHH